MSWAFTTLIHDHVNQPRKSHTDFFIHLYLFNKKFNVFSVRTLHNFMEVHECKLLSQLSPTCSAGRCCDDKCWTCYQGPDFTKSTKPFPKWLTFSRTFTPVISLKIIKKFKDLWEHCFYIKEWISQITIKLFKFPLFKILDKRNWVYCKLFMFILFKK